MPRLFRWSGWRVRIKCPCCGEKFRPEFRKVPGVKARLAQCPGCGVRLEPADLTPLAILMLLVVLALIFSYRFWGFENVCADVGVVVVAGLAVFVIIARKRPKWLDVLPHIPSSPTVRMWKRVRNIGLIGGLSLMILSHLFVSLSISAGQRQVFSRDYADGIGIAARELGSGGSGRPRIRHGTRRSGYREMVSQNKPIRPRSHHMRGAWVGGVGRCRFRERHANQSPLGRLAGA